MNITSIRNKLTIWMPPLVKLLARTGISPNMVTLLSLLFGIGGAVSFAFGQFILGSILLMLSGFFDLADGSVARITGKKSRFGAFIDWIADKYIDGLVLLGAGISIFVVYPWYLTDIAIPSFVYALVCGAAILGSIMNTFVKPVAYTEIGFQGKADGKIADPLEGVGFFGRPETMILLILGGFTGFLWIALLIIAVCTNVSAIQRVLYLWKKYGRKAESKENDKQE